MTHKFSFTLQAKATLLTHDVAKIYNIVFNAVRKFRTVVLGSLRISVYQYFDHKPRFIAVLAHIKTICVPLCETLVWLVCSIFAIIHG
jgi:hypothetical protein